MTIYKTLRSLISKTTTRRPKTTRSFLTASNPPSPLTQHHPPLNYPFALPSKWVIFFPPFQGGPLFLSSPPWKLSQSATPLLHRNGVVLRRLNLEDLGLIKGRRKRKVKEAGGEGGVRSVQARSGPVEEMQEKEGIIRSFVNLPNLISMARLVSGPFIGWMITHEMYTEAFVGLAISGLTDWLDGYVARKMRINSVVGSYLDPLADKVLIGSVALAMVHMDLLHPGLVGLVVLRDVALVGGAVYHRARSLGWKWSSWYDFVNLDGTQPEKVEPLFISKVNTVFQLLLVAAALLQPELGSPETQSYITYLSWLVASTTVASTAAYGAQYMRNRSLLLTKKS